MTNNGVTKNKKPGDALIGIGIFLVIVSVLLTVLAIANGHFGSPVSWLALLAGVVLAGFGFARRVLAALENR